MDEVKEAPKVVKKPKLSEKFKLKRPTFKKPSREFLKGFAVGGASGLMGGVLIESRLGLTDRIGNDDYDDLDDPDLDVIDDPEIIDE